jgi:nucleotide-binding universal stress UspA family protein
MAFKDLLLALTSYPEPTPLSAADEAIAFAAALGARISAVACEIRFQMPGSPFGKTLLDVSAMAAGESKKSLANAEQLLVTFQAAAEKQGVFQDRLLERCLRSELPRLLIELARLRDLTIIPVPAEGHNEQSLAEAVVFGSGRPVVVLPCSRTRAGAFALDSVIVAWDFSRPASRAVADALPILEKAKQVCVVTVTNEKPMDAKRSAAELAKHLSRHRIDVALETVDAAGRSIGEVLESCANSRRADLLVMGAYGHSRLREFILGGATRSMLSRPPVPVLLSH